MRPLLVVLLFVLVAATHSAQLAPTPTTLTPSVARVFPSATPKSAKPADASDHKSPSATTTLAASSVKVLPQPFLPDPPTRNESDKENSWTLPSPFSPNTPQKNSTAQQKEPHTDSSAHDQNTTSANSEHNDASNTNSTAAGGPQEVAQDHPQAEEGAAHPATDGASSSSQPPHDGANTDAKANPQQPAAPATQPPAADQHAQRPPPHDGGSESESESESGHEDESEGAERPATTTPAPPATTTTSSSSSTSSAPHDDDKKPHDDKQEGSSAAPLSPTTTTTTTTTTTPTAANTTTPHSDSTQAQTQHDAQPPHETQLAPVSLSTPHEADNTTAAQQPPQQHTDHSSDTATTPATTTPTTDHNDNAPAHEPTTTTTPAPTTTTTTPEVSPSHAPSSAAAPAHAGPGTDEADDLPTTATQPMVLGGAGPAAHTPSSAPPASAAGVPSSTPSPAATPGATDSASAGSSEKRNEPKGEHPHSDGTPDCDACLKGFDRLGKRCFDALFDIGCLSRDRSRMSAACKEREASIQENLICQTNKCRRVQRQINSFDPNKLEEVDDIYLLRTAYKGNMNSCRRLDLIFEYCERAVSWRSPVPVCLGSESQHFCQKIGRCVGPSTPLPQNRQELEKNARLARIAAEPITSSPNPDSVDGKKAL